MMLPGVLRALRVSANGHGFRKDVPRHEPGMKVVAVGRLVHHTPTNSPEAAPWPRAEPSMPMSRALCCSKMARKSPVEVELGFNPVPCHAASPGCGAAPRGLGPASVRNVDGCRLCHEFRHGPEAEVVSPPRRSFPLSAQKRLRHDEARPVFADQIHQ